MKKFIYLMMLFVLLAACSKEIDFVDDGVFIQMELYLASEGNYLDFFPQVITVSTNGEVRLFTEERGVKEDRWKIHVGGDAPVVEREISLDEVEQLQELIRKNNFMSMKRDVTDYRAMDGSGSRIIVYTTDEKKTVGGENSRNEKYNEIEERIFSYVEDDYDLWKEETKEYIYEFNEK